MALVETAPRTGGSAQYAGFIWTAPTPEVMREVNPAGDPALGARLVEGYPEAIDWVRSWASIQGSGDGARLRAWLPDGHATAALDVRALRANAYSTGDGLRLGLSVGAGFGKENAGFYGHLVPSGVAARDVHDLWTMTFYHSEHGALVNLHGQRFVDETIGDHLNALAVLDQPQARALLVCDQRVHDEWMLRPYVAGVTAPRARPTRRASSMRCRSSPRPTTWPRSSPRSRSRSAAC